MECAPVRRVDRKEATRQRVLDAARRLFSEKGYAETTLRQVAKEAGTSTGSVFTTFESKEDVLFAIVAEGYDALAEAISIESEGQDSAREKLKRGFAAAYRFEHGRLGLLMAQLGASWTWSHAFEAQSQARLAKPFGFILSLVGEAYASGELRAEVDPAVFADMLLGVYLRNFRHAWFRGLDPDAMAQMGARQIDVLFEGGGRR